MCKCLNGADGCETPQGLNVSSTMNDTLFAKSTYSQTPSKMMVVVLMNTTKSFLSKLDDETEQKETGVDMF